MTRPPEPLTLLLVDDEDEVRTAAREAFAAAMPGLRVITAPNGERGLDVLRTQGVDVVIADYRMPGMDGIEFLAHARTLKARVPRIMLTAYPDVDLAKQAVNDANVVRFLTKPIDPDALVSAICDVLDGVRTRDAQTDVASRLPGRAP